MTWAVKQLCFFMTLVLLSIGLFLYRAPLTVQTTLTDLIPTDTNLIPADLIQSQSREAYLLVQAADFHQALPVAQHLSAELNNIPNITVSNNSFPSFRSLKKFFSDHANAYLSQADRDLLRHGETASLREQTVQAILTSLQPSLFSVVQDPFQLLSRYATNLPLSMGNWLPRDSFLSQTKNDKSYILIPFHFTTSDIDTLSSGISRLQNFIRGQTDPNVSVFLTGIPVHTVREYHNTKSDISLFSTLSVFSTILLIWGLFRKGRVFIPIITDLIVAFITGTLLLFLFCPTPHLITFVFGTALIGICIDYSFHFLSTGRGIRNIFYSFVTTGICFLPLLFSGITLLNQIALLTLGGLTGAFFWLYLSHTDLPTVSIALLHIPTLSFSKRLVIGLFLSGLSLSGLFFVTPDCRLSDLYRPAPDLEQAETLFYRLNDQSFSQFLIIRGSSLQELLETEESLKETHAFLGLSDFIPSLKRQTENHDLIQSLYQAESHSLTEALGLISPPVFHETSPVSTDVLNQEPFASLVSRFLKKTDAGYISVLPVRDSFSNLPNNVILFSPTQNLTRQLTQYANDSYRSLCICLVGLLAFLIVLYRCRALLYLLPSLFGLGTTLGLFILLGQTVTVFHILSLFIVLGLSLDYTIFHLSPDSPHHLRPVFFSFLTSLIAFGLLSGTQFFLVHVMGLTIAIGLFLSYCISLFIFRSRS